MSDPNLEDLETFRRVRAEFTITWNVQRESTHDSWSEKRSAQYLRDLCWTRDTEDRRRGKKRHFTPPPDAPGTVPQDYLSVPLAGTALGCPCASCTRVRTQAVKDRIPRALSPHCRCTLCASITNCRTALQKESPDVLSGCVTARHNRTGVEHVLYSNDHESFTRMARGTLAERLSARREAEACAISYCLDSVRTSRRLARAVRDTCGQVTYQGYRCPIRDMPRILNEAAMNRVYQHKAPTTPERYVGVEIECGIDNIYQRESVALSMARAGLAKHVNVGTDGSITGFNTGLEIRVLATESELGDVLTRTCAVLKTHGARVNKSCGLHVHLDHRPTSGRDYRQTYTKLVAAQPWLWAVVAPSRRDNAFVRRMKGRKLSDRSPGNHYDGISAKSAYDEHNTVEVRLHHGTTNAGKILNWVRLLLAVVDGPELARCPKRLATFARKLSLPEDLTRWIAQRALVLGGAKEEDLLVPEKALSEPWEEDLEETREAEGGLVWETLQVSGAPVLRSTPVDAVISLAS